MINNIISAKYRDPSFEPVVPKKHERNISGVEEAIISLYTKGQSRRDITNHIKSICKFILDPSSISRITDEVLPDTAEFQSRSLKWLMKLYLLMEFHLKLGRINL